MAMKPADQTDALALAEHVREACIAAAQEGYQDAAMRGLCHDGAWEAALSAMKMLDLRTAIGEQTHGES